MPVLATPCAIKVSNRSPLFLIGHSMLTWPPLLLAIAGLASSTGFLVLVIVAAVRFRRRKSSPLVDDAHLPPVTLLKPLCGLEPNLEANLASFFQQNYPKFEIIFGTRDPQDPAL